MVAAATHLVLIPSYNTGPRLLSTVQDALGVWPQVWIVIDGSTDGSDAALTALQRSHRGLRVLHRSENGGKGAAVITGLTEALSEGFTHALVMDADGQHPTDHIVSFIEASQAAPDAMILGRPIFGPEVPLERLYGRQLSIGLTHVETLGREVADPLYGFRVYPIQPLLQVLGETNGGRRYDFDPEVVVRLFWAGVRPINVAAPCRYFRKDEGGVSHYHYIRDNFRMVRLHGRLLRELCFGRWRDIRRRRLRPQNIAAAS
jgi:glycosyltransferase involved in cell wall biosynthesis